MSLALFKDPKVNEAIDRNYASLLPHFVESGGAENDAEWKAHVEARRITLMSDYHPARSSSAMSAFGQYLFCYGSHERPIVFLDTMDTLWSYGDVPAWFMWIAVQAEWPFFDRVPHQGFTELFAEWRHEWRPRFIMEDARHHTKRLRRRKRVTLYRGQNEGDPLGLSWTFNKDIAASFAIGHRAIFNRNPVVYTASIIPTEIAFLCPNRGEDEAVLFNTESVSIINSEALETMRVYE